MHVAVWNTPPAEFFVSDLESSPTFGSVEVERCAPQDSVDLLQRGLVDVALVPTLVAFTNTDLLDVLPGAVLSTWAYPYAKLVLRKDLGQIRTLGFDPRHAQEAFIARIILREHYGQEPVFIPVEQRKPDALYQADEGAALLVGDEVPLLETGHLTLDLGQEWYELVNYPMVWGLFATRKDEATPAMVEALLAAIEAAEANRFAWIRDQDVPPALQPFFSDDLRLRFDDLATAGLTEFCQYLYFYNLTDEIPELPLYALPEDWHDGEERTPLL
ncbi:MAG: MqnA/MqnD/SBP family protein [Rhodothermales bacterium]